MYRYTAITAAMSAALALVSLPAAAQEEAQPLTGEDAFVTWQIGRAHV